MDCTVVLWDAETGAKIRGPLEGPTEYLQSMAFSPDGKIVASGSDDTTICIWNLETGGLTTDPLLAFSPDGKRVVSGSADGTIHA